MKIAACVLVLNILVGIAVGAQEQEGLAVLEDNVAFIFDPVRTQDPCAVLPRGQSPLPLGTGFFVGIPAKGSSLAKDRWSGLNFLITAKHVVKQSDRIIVRLNRADHTQFVCSTILLRQGGSDRNLFVSKNPEVDLAAIAFSQVAGTDPVVIPYQNILDQQSMRARDVGEGTDIFTIGYLYGYGGQQKNYPVKKFGKIALLTEEKWLLTAGSNAPAKAYLVELQNVPGLSGAPVILQSPRLLIRNNQLSFSRGGPYLIGVVKDLLAAPIDGNYLISQGVAAVEPGEELKELLQEIARMYAPTTPLELPDTPVPQR